MNEIGPAMVLLVEDDEAFARALAIRLEAVGYAVHTEPCGSAALSYAGAHRPELVILDLRLPDMDGYEVCRRLRALYSRWDVPIVMLTGLDRPIDELRGFAHGADAYLVKPCSSGELLQTIALLLGQTTTASRAWTA